MSNCIPSVNSSSIPKVWPSSTFTTPSLPTFSIASAMMLPISSSAAEIDADLGDLLLAADLGRLLFAQVVDDRLTARLDALAQPERVGSGSDVLEARVDDRLRQQRRRRRAVAGDVVGRRGDLADELCALVGEHVLDLDLTRDRDAVVGDRRRAELLVEHDVATLRAERDLDRVGDGVDARPATRARFRVVLQLLVSHI